VLDVSINIYRDARGNLGNGDSTVKPCRGYWSRGIIRIDAHRLKSATAGAETFKPATNLPAGHSMVRHGIAPWMTCVKDASQGALDFNFSPAVRSRRSPRHEYFLRRR
jgi:hypothetical protein